MYTYPKRDNYKYKLRSLLGTELAVVVLNKQAILRRYSRCTYQSPTAIVMYVTLLQVHFIKNHLHEIPKWTDKDLSSTEKESQVGRR